MCRRSECPTTSAYVSRSCALNLTLMTAIVFGIFSDPVLAADGEPDNDKFVFKVGLYLVSSMSTELRVDPAAGIGTSIGLEQTLNMPDNVQVQRFDGHYRFNNKQRFEFSYFEISRGGYIDCTGCAPLTVGNVTLNPGIWTSYGQTKVLKGLWSHSFINDDKYEFGLGAGLHITSSSTDIASSGGGGNISENFTLPLPVFSFRGAWHITPKLKLEGKQDMFLVEFGGSRGAMVDLTLRLEHQTTRHVGFGLGTSLLSTRAQTVVDGYNTELNASYRGTMLYAKAVF